MPVLLRSQANIQGLMLMQRGRSRLSEVQFKQKLWQLCFYLVKTLTTKRKAFM
jgi:hypothetical protein